MKVESPDREKAESPAWIGGEDPSGIETEGQGVCPEPHRQVETEGAQVEPASAVVKRAGGSAGTGRPARPAGLRAIHSTEGEDLLDWYDHLWRNRWP
jgi:hypothetical protein